MRFKTNSSGFSLIEMAIGLLIVGLITGPMMMEYASWKNSQLHDLTVGNELKIETALTKYAQNNGCYPLPAPPGVLSTAATFGLEAVRTPADLPCRDITAGELAAIPTCAGGDAVVCKTACVASATCTTGTPIIIGDAPFATLGLPKEYIVDGFHRKYTYAVSSNLLQSSTFNNLLGVVKIADLTNGGPPGPAVFGGLSTGPAVTDAHYALVSHGRDGVGAFTLDGGTLVATCTGAGVDREDCDNDGLFNNGFDAYNDMHRDSWAAASQQLKYERVETNGTGATHFDDYVIYSESISSDIWAKNNNSDVVSNNGSAGNVLVKTAASASGISNPQARLDVRGDVSATRLWTNAVCDTSSNTYGAGAYTNTKCVTDNTINNTGFKPDTTIAYTNPPKTGSTPGNGIHCGSAAGIASLPAGTGIPMTGIAQADEQCATMSSMTVVNTSGVNITLAGCATGFLPYAIVGGVIQCSSATSAPPP